MKKKWLLPGLAGLMAVVAALVILLLPGSGQKHSVYSCWMGMIRGTIEVTD